MKILMALVHLVAIVFDVGIGISEVFWSLGLLLIIGFETLVLLESLIGPSGTIYDFWLFR